MNSKTSVRKNSKTIYSYYVRVYTRNGYKVIIHEDNSLDDLREYIRKNIAWIMRVHDHRTPGFDLFPIRCLSITSYDTESRAIHEVEFFEPEWTDYELFDRPEYIVRTWQTK